MTQLGGNLAGNLTTHTAESGVRPGVAQVQKSSIYDEFWMSSGRSRQQSVNNTSLEESTG